jgi:hypothetical protein
VQIRGGCLGHQPNYPVGPITGGRSLTISGNNTVTLAAGDYLYNNINIQDRGRLLASSCPVRIWFSGSIVMTGSGATQDPNLQSLAANMSFYSTTSTSSVNLSSNAVLIGTIFAPNAPITMGGNAQVFGRAIGKTITMSGNAAAHFDQRLGSDLANPNCSGIGVTPTLTQTPETPHSSVRLADSAREISKGSSPSYSLPAGKKVLAVPNPATNQATIFFNMPQMGTAYLSLMDLSGNLLIRKTLGDQQAGTGSAQLDLKSYASGIYYVVFEADLGYGISPQAIFKLAILK